MCIHRENLYPEFSKTHDEAYNLSKACIYGAFSNLLVMYSENLGYMEVKNRPHYIISERTFELKRNTQSIKEDAHKYE